MSELGKSAALTACRSLPVFPNQRTLSGSLGMSQNVPHADIRVAAASGAQ